MMITALMSSVDQKQNLCNDETLCDEDQSAFFCRTVNVQYLSREYILRKENSLGRPMKTEPIDEEKTLTLKTFNTLTPRNIALLELITSEQRFVHDMNNILQTYILPMLKSKILSSSHIDAFFLNWPSLTRAHEKLVNALLIGLKTSGEQISMGSILCEFMPELMIEYEVYFRFHPTAVKYFREQFNISSKFRAFMQKTKQESYGIGTMGDANILTLPLQRIAKYPFMIYQILKNTSNDCVDLIQLHESLEKANELRATVNNAIDEELNRVKFEWLQKHLDWSKISETIVFDSLTHCGDQRNLIHYGHLRLSKSTNRLLCAMLFNDFFLLTRLKRPLLTKILRTIHRATFTYQQQRRSPSTIDWFEAPEADHLDLTVYKKPLMLYEMSNVRMLGDDLHSAGFQFDYRGRQMIFFASSVNERLLWTKNISEAIDICRRRRLLTMRLRAPESNFNLTTCRPIGKVLIQVINAVNLPLSYVQKNGNNPYCIIEVNNGQRQTTPVLWDTSFPQWNASFQFFICDINKDLVKFFVYNRSKYSTDRLLGSVEIPLSLMVERRSHEQDSSSIYLCSLATNTTVSPLYWKTRTFLLQRSSHNSQLRIKYVVYLNE